MRRHLARTLLGTSILGLTACSSNLGFPPPAGSARTQPSKAPSVEPSQIPQASKIGMVGEVKALISLETATTNDIAPIWERSYVDRPDDKSGYQVHFLYFLPHDAAKDERFDTNGALSATIWSIDRWFFEQTGNLRLRFDTYQGEPDITFFRSPRDEAALAANEGFIRNPIGYDLRDAKILQPRKIYCVFFGGSVRLAGGCGSGVTPPPFREGDQVAVVYAKLKCGRPSEVLAGGIGDGGLTAVHEILHTLGFAHVLEANDVLSSVDRTKRPTLDAGRSTYFRHGQPGRLDLANSVFWDPLPSDPAPPPGWPNPPQVLVSRDESSSSTRARIEVTVVGSGGYRASKTLPYFGTRSAEEQLLFNDLPVGTASVVAAVFDQEGEDLGTTAQETTISADRATNVQLLLTLASPARAPVQPGSYSPIVTLVDGASISQPPIFSTPVGVVTTLAGSNLGRAGFQDGATTSARFFEPQGLAVSSDGTVFVSDRWNFRIRRIRDGTVTTFAGSGKKAYADGASDSASFDGPRGLSIRPDGSLVVSDPGNRVLRGIGPDGTVTTFAGDGRYQSADGPATLASFFYPIWHVSDSDGRLFVGDCDGNRIRRIALDGVVSTVAGQADAGSADGVGPNASFNCPAAQAVDTAGNLYVADQKNNMIRIVSSGAAVRKIVGSLQPGFRDGDSQQALLNKPIGIAVAPSGDVYFSDSGNHRIRRINVAGLVTTVAGVAKPGYTDSIGPDAAFRDPAGLAFDPNGNLLVADLGNHVIRKISFGRPP